MTQDPEAPANLDAPLGRRDVRQYLLAVSRPGNVDRQYTVRASPQAFRLPLEPRRTSLFRRWPRVGV